MKNKTIKFKNKFLNIVVSSLLLIFITFAYLTNAKTTIPTPTNYKYLNDYVGALNDTESKNIISIGKELEDKTTAQAVVVIINSTNGIPIESYAIDLFRTWGIGQKEKDNGLLILLAINDKKWRVEVGRGLEGAIPDALSNRVMESIAKPNFINGTYGKGIVESYSAFSDYIAKEYNVTLDKSLNVTVPNNTSSNSKGGIIAIGIFILLLLLDIIFNRGRIFSTLLQIMFWDSINRRNGPRGGGGFGGGSSGGGFGGGSSSGGGSSGSW